MRSRVKRAALAATVSELEPGANMGEHDMFGRLAIVALAAFIRTSAAGAEILQCEVKAAMHGDQEHRIVIVVPEAADHRYEMALTDPSSAQLRLLGVGEYLPGRKLLKGLGTIEISTKNIFGRFSESKRYDFVAFSPPLKGIDLHGIFFRHGFEASFPGIVFVDRTTGAKKITLADATHMPSVLSLFTGTCS